jgi:hypothetical protein
VLWEGSGEEDDLRFVVASKGAVYMLECVASWSGQELTS